MLELDRQRNAKRTELYNQAETVKSKYLDSDNLRILKALHAKIMQYIESDHPSTSDLEGILEGLDSLIAEIQKKEGKTSSGNKVTPSESK